MDHTLKKHKPPHVTCSRLFSFSSKEDLIRSCKYVITQLFIIASVVTSSLNHDAAYILVHKVILFVKEILLPLVISKDV